MSSARKVVTLKNSVPADWMTATHHAAALRLGMREPDLDRAAGGEEQRADEERQGVGAGPTSST